MDRARSFIEWAPIPPKLQLSEDGAYLVYVISYGSGSEQTEIHVQNVKENGPVVAAVTDEKALFFPTVAGDRLFILTNSKAPQWRVLSTSLATPTREHWREVVPESDIHLEAIAASGEKLIGQYTRNAASELKVFDTNGKVQSSIALPALFLVRILQLRTGHFPLRREAIQVPGLGPEQCPIGFHCLRSRAGPVSV
jgi:protease II